jgi:hypothetical protein
MSETHGVPVEDVYQREYEKLEGLSQAAQLQSGQVARDQLLGLALSGGGIRSATFNLGILQALARARLLKEFDYLSTVSGGGYIGSWLSAWVKRSKSGVQDVENALAQGAEPPQIRFLREFSNYLTPRTGWFSTDTLTGVTTYVRNLLLNLSILVLIVAALLLGPWLLGGAAASAADTGFLGHERAGYLYLILAEAALLVAAYGMAKSLACLDEYDRRTAHAARSGAAPVLPATPPAWAEGNGLAVRVVLPLVASAFALNMGAWAQPHVTTTAMWVAGVSFIVLILAFRWLCPRIVKRAFPPVELPWKRDRWLRKSLALIVGSLFAGAVLVGLSRLLATPDGTPDAAALWHALVLGAPVALLVFLFAGTLVVGLSGRRLSEFEREWWGRLGAVVVRAGLLWAVLCATSIYGAWLVWKMGAWASGVGLAWLGSTALAVLTAMSRTTGDEGSRRWRELIPKLGPYVFMLGLLVAVAAGLYALSFALATVSDGASCTPQTFLERCAIADYLNGLAGAAAPGPVLGAIVVLAAVAGILSWLIDINLFSFHSFYRNRLVRCFLGASNSGRKAVPFIGFDSADNPRLADLVQRPYHIINTALNLTSSKRLSWQERKAGSFVLTPLYCGYQFPDLAAQSRPEASGDPCFQPTSDYAKDEDGHLSLGTALAISGAAASPNMGYHSTASVAFLLTVFNVRLGWWMQNPSSAENWRRGGPYLGLRYLLSELLGLTSEETPFVYVSDGGHFENLGIYELVRRKCRFIVASDASRDKGFEFEDLGNAIRKCQIDLGVRIEIDRRAIVPDPVTRRSLYHCAVGTVQYRDRAPGYLLYIKPSLTGNEPADVSQYAAACGDFPHETTGDQWFSESQFESYRKLGQHIGWTVLRDAGLEPDPERRTDRESIFVALKERWYPPSGAVKDAFTHHAQALESLEQMQRNDELLRFLDMQVYPEWERLDQVAPGPAKNLWLPRRPEELRAGFYFCRAMLELMENVYIDLDLEEQCDHPDNRGWMNLFRHWSWSGMFKVTYSICCAMLGARFQRFCERRLDLWPGDVSAVSETVDAAQLEAVLERASAQKQLNFVEVEMIERLHRAGVAFDRIELFQLEVWSPETLDRADATPGSSFLYIFGFALTRGQRLVYFRVQDHLRKMGHARRALSKLCYREENKITGHDVDKLRDLEIEWLERQDFDGFERLLKSVQQQGRDLDGAR